MNRLTLSMPLAGIEWLTPQRVKQLERFGLRTVEDLLTHFPRRHEDRRKFDRFPQQESETPVCVCGLVAKISVKRLPGWKKMIEVVLQEEPHALSPTLVCRWFNAHFVEKIIAVGQRLVVFGKPKLRSKKICIDHPEFEIVENDDDLSIHLKRITPVHPATEGLSARQLRAWIFRGLEQLDHEQLPKRLPSTLDDSSFCEALRQIHFPSGWEELERARRHLVLHEFFAMQLFIATKKAETVSRPGEAHSGSGQLLEQFHAALPFPLTGAQTRAVAEIRSDLESSRPMNRLLHGDVGSGKTVVALSAMLLAVEAGFQAALMAPTQILAEQHYLNFKRWLEPLGIRIALRTGDKKEESNGADDLDLWTQDDNSSPKESLTSSARKIPSGTPQILIGTHALLYEGVEFSNPGLVVIDEQHKFGVMQRAQLISRGTLPDVLVMTATPIPRTLTMTVYGDLDVSTLDEMPANRGKIITALRDPSKLPDAIKFLKEHLEAGRQAYIVYPLIDESEKLSAKAATLEFEKWKESLKPMTCELLHGRIDSAEKERIMERFRCGEVKALIATTVIEVGIDVPNANIMIIENAERFGLAQIHQLRGRIGRGSHKSYCILFSSAENIGAIEKLRILEKTSNGFEIAEADLRLRGSGDILGTAQSGLPPFKLGNLLEDAELMQQARKSVQEIFERDPFLKNSENKGFRELVVERRKLTLSQVS